MKYIDQSCVILDQEPGINGIFKQIERAGRTCYKSEDKITDDSAEKFVQRMIDSEHTAMLEHGTVYLYFKHDDHDGVDFGDPWDISLTLTLNKYTSVRNNFETHEAFYTTNLRVLVEQFPSFWRDVLDKHMVDWDDRFIPRVTAILTTSRQVANECVRHRTMSFAQESTRYCNYTKDKFGGELTFIEPQWSKKDKGAHEQLTSALRYAETYYKYLIERGLKPQDAAAVLPNDLKTTLVITGDLVAWDHFFNLRALGTTGKPHPEMQSIAEELRLKFFAHGYFNAPGNNPFKHDEMEETVDFEEISDESKDKSDSDAE